MEDLPATVGILSGSLSAELFIQVFAVAFTLGLIGGLCPAWRASGLVRLETLSYEGGRGAQAHLLHHRGNDCEEPLPAQSRGLLTMVDIGIAMMVLVVLGALADGLMAQMTILATSGGT